MLAGVSEAEQEQQKSAFGPFTKIAAPAAAANMSTSVSSLPRSKAGTACWLVS